MRPHHHRPVRHAVRRYLVLLAALGLFAACSSADEGDGTSPPTTAAATTTTVPTDADAPTVAEVQAAVDASPAGCDPLDTTRCLLPFPSNASTVADPSDRKSTRLNSSH